MRIRSQTGHSETLSVARPPSSQRTSQWRRQATLAPRPELNGLRVQQYGDPSVYLMDQGLRRLIPTQQVKARLFTLGASWVHRYDAAAPGVILDLHVSQMDAGLPLPE